MLVLNCMTQTWTWWHHGGRVARLGHLPGVFCAVFFLHVTFRCIFVKCFSGCNGAALQTEVFVVLWVSEIRGTGNQTKKNGMTTERLAPYFCNAWLYLIHLNECVHQCEIRPLKGSRLKLESHLFEGHSSRKDAWTHLHSAPGSAVRDLPGKRSNVSTFHLQQTLNSPPFELRRSWAFPPACGVLKLFKRI